MDESLAWVYAFAEVFEPDVLESLPEGVDGSKRFSVAGNGELVAVFSPVDPVEFSQEVIDRRSRDLDWLGRLGFRHQSVIAHLAERTTVVPLRAFTLFSSIEKLVDYLDQNEDDLSELLEALEGREEWTIRVELDAERWQKGIVARVESLAQIERDAESASSGKAFLLRKQLDEKRKEAAKEAEASLVRELEASIESALDCDLIVETRQQKEGSFPQLDILIAAGDRDSLASLHEKLQSKHAAEGVTLVLTGPWPPYSFARAGEGNGD